MLLDAASLYFRAFYGVPDTVRAPDGTPVNAVRGFLDIIARLVTDFEPTHMVACWDDDWRPQWRVALIPSYKLHRVEEIVPGGADIETTPDDLTVQIPIITQVLAALGITVIGAAEHEADDVIGSLAKQADVPVDIVTGDRDLFQLVDDSTRVRVVYTARGVSRLEVVTEDVIRSKYGINPQQYADFAVMRGDTSDGLPGVPGIGEKTAANLLREYGDLDTIIAVANDPEAALSSSLKLRIRAAAAYLHVAPAVVTVVPDLELGPFDAKIRSVSDQRRDIVDKLASQWGLGGSAGRVVQALAEHES
jgi:5'-3' exonuclease